MERPELGRTVSSGALGGRERQVANGIRGEDAQSVCGGGQSWGTQEAQVLPEAEGMGHQMLGRIGLEMQKAK